VDSLIGLALDDAIAHLKKLGINYTVQPYASLKGVPDADKTIAIRTKKNGDTIELLVSDFKTKLD